MCTLSAGGGYSEPIATKPQLRWLRATRRIRTDSPQKGRPHWARGGSWKGGGEHQPPLPEGGDGQGGRLATRWGANPPYQGEMWARVGMGDTLLMCMKARVHVVVMQEPTVHVQGLN